MSVKASFWHAIVCGFLYKTDGVYSFTWKTENKWKCIIIIWRRWCEGQDLGDVGENSRGPTWVGWLIKSSLRWHAIWVLEYEEDKWREEGYVSKGMACFKSLGQENIISSRNQEVTVAKGQLAEEKGTCDQVFKTGGSHTMGGPSAGAGIWTACGMQQEATDNS